LATFTQHPEDLPREGNLIWVKMLILGMITVFIPMFIPRRYVPIDPKVFVHIYLQTVWNNSFILGSYGYT